MRTAMIAASTVLVALGLVVAPALAQRDPAYAAARAEGKVGEQADGYLGIVGPADPVLQRLVDDINIKRRAVYAEKAKENNATLEAYALTAGCQAVLVMSGRGREQLAIATAAGKNGFRVAADLRSAVELLLQASPVAA